MFFTNINLLLNRSKRLKVLCQKLDFGLPKSFTFLYVVLCRQLEKKRETPYDSDLDVVYFDLCRFSTDIQEVKEGRTRVLLLRVESKYFGRMTYCNHRNLNRT